MSALREDWKVLLGLLPSDWEQLGRSTGAVTRLRGFNSLNDLFRTLLMHVGCGWSLRETAVQAKLAGIADVFGVTQFKRLRPTADLLRPVCHEVGRRHRGKLLPGPKTWSARRVGAP